MIRFSKTIRLSTRTLLAVFAIVNLCLAFFVVPAESQRSIVTSIRNSGGQIGYFASFSVEGKCRSSEFSKPSIWMIENFGEQFSRIAPRIDDYFASVVWVYMGGKHITNEDVSQLESLGELRALFLEGTSVNDAGLKLISSSEILTSLGLSGTAITDEGLIEVLSLPLRYLDLTDTEVTDQGVLLLAKMSTLEKVLLPEHISLEAARELQLIMNDCIANRR